MNTENSPIAGQSLRQQCCRCPGREGVRAKRFLSYVATAGTCMTCSSSARVCIHTYIYIYIHTRHTCIWIHMCIYIYECAHIHLHACGLTCFKSRTTSCSFSGRGVLGARGSRLEVDASQDCEDLGGGQIASCFVSQSIATAKGLPNLDTNIYQFYLYTLYKKKSPWNRPTRVKGAHNKGP